MKMPSCRNAAAGFLPVISRPDHYGVSRSEEKQSADASLTHRVLLGSAGGGRCCSDGGPLGGFLNRSDEVAQLCPALCLETLTGLY